LYFYVQAAFYAVLPRTYGTARLVSTAAGLLGLWLLWHWERRLPRGLAAAAWGLGAYSCSRWFYFPAIFARPDILCTLFGYLAIAQLDGWRRSGRRSHLIAAGISIGLGGLTHPFALVYAVQLAAWAAWAARGWERVRRPLLLAAWAVGVALVWLPLIAVHPDVFQVQFGNQFLHDEGGSLLYRAVMPWESLWYHGRFLWEHAGPIQFLLLSVGLAYGLVDALRRRDAARAIAPVLGATSVYLICVLVGPHHHVIGYWSYTAGLSFVGLGRAVDDLQQAATARRLPSRLTGIGLAGLLGLALLPGSGLRATWAYVRHWNDLDYDAPRFARQLIASLPPESAYAVDTQFALDFVVHGRKTLLAQTRPIYFRVDQHAYDTLILSRYGLSDGLLDRVGAAFVRSVGDREDEFACYAEVHHGRSPPPAPGAPPNVLSR
jgi:hypothetical protein